MRPLIGITCSGDEDSFKLRRGYVECVRAAGGECVIVPPDAAADVICDALDGWLIPGGDDFDGALFGEPTHPSAELEDPRRTEAELRMFKAWPIERPVLGICYGCQLINVALGGGLVQHLPDVIGNDSHSGNSMQNYEVAPDSRLFGIVGGEAVGKSSHHQACRRLGDGLRAVARTQDGVIEAVESTNSRWLFGLQWHPERTPDGQDTRAVFKAFVEAARR